MNLDINIINYIKDNILPTAALAGIEGVIIDKRQIRALGPNKTVIMLQNHNLDVPFETLGLSRLKLFESRLNMIDFTKPYTFNLVYDQRSPNFVSKIEMKSGRIKLDYTAANPKIITAPDPSPSGGQNIIDTAVIDIKLSDDDIKTLVKGSACMPQKSETSYVTIITDPVNSSTKMCISDTSSDGFEMDVEGEIQYITNEPVVANYPLKHVLQLAKEGSSIKICTKQMLYASVNNIGLFFLPIR